MSSQLITMQTGIYCRDNNLNNPVTTVSNLMRTLILLQLPMLDLLAESDTKYRVEDTNGDSASPPPQRDHRRERDHEKHRESDLQSGSHSMFIVLFSSFPIIAVMTMLGIFS